MEQTHKWTPFFEILLLSVTMTFEVQTWFLCTTQCHMLVNISAKKIQNSSKNNKVMEQTQKWTQFFRYNF